MSFIIISTFFIETEQSSRQYGILVINLGCTCIYKKRIQKIYTYGITKQIRLCECQSEA